MKDKMKKFKLEESKLFEIVPKIIYIFVILGAFLSVSSYLKPILDVRIKKEVIIIYTKHILLFFKAMLPVVIPMIFPFAIKKYILGKPYFNLVSVEDKKNVEATRYQILTKEIDASKYRAVRDFRNLIMFNAKIFGKISIMLCFIYSMEIFKNVMEYIVVPIAPKEASLALTAAIFICVVAIVFPIFITVTESINFLWNWEIDSKTIPYEEN